MLSLVWSSLEMELRGRNTLLHGRRVGCSLSNALKVMVAHDCDMQADDALNSSRHDSICQVPSKG